VPSGSGEHIHLLDALGGRMSASILAAVRPAMLETTDGFAPTALSELPKRPGRHVARRDHAIHAPTQGKFMTKTFAEFANWVAVASGHPIVFGVATLSVVAWLATGPFFSYFDTWQLVMNTWTNVATFLMVFLIQNSQNRDSSAIQAKLDDLVRTSNARNFLVGIEKLTRGASSPWPGTSSGYMRSALAERFR
jgi:low affinity Fe/Cu permease